MPPSPSTDASATPPSDSPQFKGPASRHSPPAAPGPSNSRVRRPLSPSSLRDVDLSHTAETMTRNPRFPVPPTGHDLMAMFPPAPPDTFPEMRPGPTSGFFQRQERAFFAQAGKEIVRVRVEIDLPQGADADPKSRSSNTPRSWPANASPTMLIPIQREPTVPSAPGPTLYPHPANRPPPQRGAVPVTPTPLFAGPPPHSSPSAQMQTSVHPPLHQQPAGVRTPPQDQNVPAPSAASKADYPGDDYDQDDAWRRPMPYAERRRAGKHTRRVIVRT